MKQSKGKAAPKTAAKPRGAPKKGAAVIKIVALLLVLVLFGAAIYFAVITEGFTRSEYLSYNGKKLPETTRQTQLEYGENVFEVGSVNPFAGEIGYAVKVIPNPEAKFNFSADGNPVSFPKLGELTDCFDLRAEPSKITVRISGNLTLKSILKGKYSADEIVLPDDLPKELFVLSVTFGNGKAANVYFDLPGWTISIDPPSIIF